MSQLQSQHKKDQEVRRKMFMVVLSSLKHLLRQGSALRGHNEEDGNLMQLLLLRSSDHVHLKQYIGDGKYLSHDIINELVSLMGHQVLNKILSEIRKANSYSIIADEATDVSNKKQFGISFRWVSDDFSIHERPLELINVPKTDSKTLTMLIKDCLIRFILPIAQCHGQAYDGAANMSGHVSGVAAQIQSEAPTALFVHCLAHSTNLCLKTLGTQSICVHEALEVVMGLSQLIRFSQKRSTLFEALQAQMSPDAPTLKPLCPTRWTVHTKAIDAILKII